MPASMPADIGLAISEISVQYRRTELPRLPNRNHFSGRDYLGLTVLSLAITASPALFRPKPDGTEAAVRSHTPTDIDIDVVCDAFSLQANRHLSQSFLWTEYEDAAPLLLNTVSIHAHA